MNIELKQPETTPSPKGFAAGRERHDDRRKLHSMMGSSTVQAGVRPSNPVLTRVVPGPPWLVLHPRAVCGICADALQQVIFCFIFCVWGADAHMSGPLLSRRYPCPLLLLPYHLRPP